MTSEQTPASDEMRWLFHETVELSHLNLNTTLSPAARGVEWLNRHAALCGRQNALYARMQAEEQERAEMRAIVEEVAAMGKFSDACPCWSEMGASAWLDAGMPHQPDCLKQRADALLAKQDGQIPERG